MRTLLAILLLGALGLPAAAANLRFTCEGALGIDVPCQALVLDASCTVTFAAGACTASLAFDLCEAGPTGLTMTATLAGADWDIASTLAVDAPSATFDRGEAALSADLLAASLALHLSWHDNGVGLAAVLAPYDAGLVRAASLGLNVDAYGRVQARGCALPLTYAALEAGWTWACADVAAIALFTSDGLLDLALRAANIGGLAAGISFGVELHSGVGEKTLDLVPSLATEGPECFDVFLGLVWDATTYSLAGVSVNGLGVACEIDGVRVRGLWELDPLAIALVKEPYWGLLGLVWEVAMPKDQTGEASVAFFFGNAGLFSLGEILFGLEWSIGHGWTTSLALAVETAGGVLLSFGWDGGF